MVDASGLHGLACRKSAPRQQRRSHLNDIMWRAMKRAQIPVSQRARRPASARRQTPRRHHNPAVVEGKAAGMGRHSPRHVCRRPRQQHSHGNRSCSQPCRRQLDQQIQPTICNAHLHFSGHWYHQAVELVQELGRLATIITGDSRETTYLFQQLSVALQKGNAVSFQNTFTAD